MNAQQSQQALEQNLADASVSLDRLTVAKGFDLMFDFYRHQRAQDCLAGKSVDMLLFQWGAHDWGHGRFFELDLTRQFIIGDAEGEDFWQLSLTLIFLPSDELRRLGSGDKWCPEPRPRPIDYFEGFVRGSAAYQTVNGHEPAKIELDYSNAE